MTDTVTQNLILLLERDLKIDTTGVGPDTPLFEEGLDLDSFAVVDLVARIETHFGIQFADTDFRPENFTSVGTLAGVVASCMAAGAGA